MPYLCTDSRSSRSRSAAARGPLILLGRLLFVQLALLDQLQEGVALLAPYHVIINLQLLLRSSQPLRPFQVFLQDSSGP